MPNAPEKPVGLYIALAGTSLLAVMLVFVLVVQVLARTPITEPVVIFKPTETTPAPASPATPGKPSADAAKKNEDPKATNSPLKVIGSGAVQVGTLE